MTAPRCRWCGRPLRKRTRKTNVHVRRPDFTRTLSNGQFWRDIEVDEPLRTIEDAQRVTDRPIVHVKMFAELDGSKSIAWIHDWDGTSYETRYDFFCTNNCAAQMGRSAARDHNLIGPGYGKARK